MVINKNIKPLLDLNMTYKVTKKNKFLEVGRSFWLQRHKNTVMLSSDPLYTYSIIAWKNPRPNDVWNFNSIGELNKMLKKFNCIPDQDWAKKVIAEKKLEIKNLKKKYNV